MNAVPCSARFTQKVNYFLLYYQHKLKSPKFHFVHTKESFKSGVNSNQLSLNWSREDASPLVWDPNLPEPLSSRLSDMWAGFSEGEKEQIMFMVQIISWAVRHVAEHQLHQSPLYWLLRSTNACSRKLWWKRRWKGAEIDTVLPHFDCPLSAAPGARPVVQHSGP